MIKATAKYSTSGMKTYQLNLDSRDYYSSLTGASNHANRVYAVDWSFLPENKPFKMTFRLQSRRRASGGYNSGVSHTRVRCDFDNSMFQQNFNGSNATSIRNNNFIGLLVVKRSSNATDDSNILTAPQHNPPVFLPSRPTGNFITIETINNTGGTSSGITGYYLMTLFFEEVE